MLFGCCFQILQPDSFPIPSDCLSPLSAAHWASFEALWLFVREWEPVKLRSWLETKTYCLQLEVQPCPRSSTSTAYAKAKFNFEDPQLHPFLGTWGPGKVMWSFQLSARFLLFVSPAPSTDAESFSCKLVSSFAVFRMFVSTFLLVRRPTFLADQMAWAVPDWCDKVQANFALRLAEDFELVLHPYQ